MSEMLHSKLGTAPSGLIDRFMGEVQRLLEEIEMLSQLLHPVRNVGPDAGSGVQPQEAPTNRLHEGIMQVEHACARIRILRSELNL